MKKELLKKSNVTIKSRNKEHIVNNKTHYVCGLKINSKLPEAFINDGILFNSNIEKITFVNMKGICQKCLQLFHPTYKDDLINERKRLEYKMSIPTNKRNRQLKGAIKRKSIKSNLIAPKNVIYLPYKPIPIRDTKRLIEYKPHSDILIDDSIISITPNKETEIIYEDTFIQFNNGLAMIKGFNNQWQIILSENNKTESLTDWLDYNTALKEIKSLAA